MRWVRSSLAGIAAMSCLAISLLLCSVFLMQSAFAEHAAEAPINEEEGGTVFLYKIPLLLNFTSWENHTQEHSEMEMTMKGSIQRKQAMLMRYRTVKMMTELRVGTPPQRMWAVVDTASELTWLPCFNNNYNHGYFPKFHPRSSSTFRGVPCNSQICSSLGSDLPIPTSCNSKKKCAFTCSYADATSVEGELATDSFYVTNTRSFNLGFGCSHSSLVATPALLGLNRGKLSLISQLNSLAKIPRSFSLCFSSASPLGTLYLGGSPHPIHASLRYTPLVTMSIPLPYFDRSAYTVRLESIKVANIQLPIRKSVFMPDHTGAGQTMLDSASHFTLLLGEAYTALRQEFIRQNKGLLGMPMGDNFVYEGALDLCYDRAAVPVEKLSPVTLILQATQLVIPDDNFLIVREDKKSFENYLEALSLFGKASEILVNYSKSALFRPLSNGLRPDWLSLWSGRIIEQGSYVKILGIPFNFDSPTPNFWRDILLKIRGKIQK